VAEHAEHPVAELERRAQLLLDAQALFRAPFRLDARARVRDQRGGAVDHGAEEELALLRELGGAARSPSRSESATVSTEAVVSSNASSSRGSSDSTSCSLSAVLEMRSSARSV
jgi:hypothetical protein